MTRSIEQVWAYHRKKAIDKADPATVKLRNQLVELNQGLVSEQAQRWQQLCSEPYEDLFQEGNFGLIKAVEKFDPNLGKSFSSFAVPFISGAIQHYLRDKGWGSVRPPRREVERFAKVGKAKRDLQKLGRELPEAAVAQGLGMSEERWQRTVDARNFQIVSIDEDESIHLAAEEERQEEAERAWVYGELAKLPEPQKSCVTEFYFGNLKLKQIAKRRHCSEQLVQVWLDQGIAQLQQTAQRHQEAQ